MLSDEECDAVIWASRRNVEHEGTFPQRVDSDRAIVRAAYAAALEKAAEWHDGLAANNRILAMDRSAQWHERSAEAIRKMKG